MMGYGWGMGPTDWIFMSLGWLVVIGLLGWTIATLSPTWRGGWRGRAESPEEILDRRLAAGEIDIQQFRQARQELAAARGGQK